MDDAAAHDLAAQQEAAKDYQPVLEGPRVGDKTPSAAITHEYAKADAVYVEKTVALSHTYSHYRPIQGDGNCGWRAIGFSYFEKLVESGDQDKVEGEVARLMSLNHTLATVGGYTYYEDWADEVIGLLRELAAAVATPAVAHAMLLQRWNDAAVEAGLIYYLRLLAATHLKANAATYDPFVPDGQGVQAYCSQSVEVVNREIEHLGIVALVNVLLKPAGIVLEIAYLDRSPGSQVNHHRFADDAADGQELAAEAAAAAAASAASVVHLLYRPDHYDVLYRTPDAAPPQAQAQAQAPPVSMQVNRVSSLSHDVDIAGTSGSLGAFSTLDFGALAMIPGFSGLPPSSLAMALPPSSTAAAGSPWPPRFVDEVRMAPAAMMGDAGGGGGGGGGGVGGGGGGGGGGGEHKARSLLATGLAPSAGYPIRFSPVQLEYDESKSGFRESSFQVKTSTFKNSVWNRAHYGNPDFHPEEWSPEDEGEGRAGKKKGRRGEH